MFSVKRAVRKYILCYTFIHELMNNRPIYQANEPGPPEVLCGVCACVRACVCPRIEIDLATEPFNLETRNFQERYKFMCYFIKCLKFCKILRNLVMREKTRGRR